MEPILDKNGKQIKVKLLGADGNAFSILGLCDRAMKKAGIDNDIRDDFFTEATAGNYDALLQTAMKYFDVE
jgi:hypothetical protein